MNRLNLGCGIRFHRDWVNIDFVSTGEGVIAHNILEGIPFADNTFDAVYHSHLLEHIPRAGAERFMRECYRVLKRGGILRVAVPDLETIARTYIMLLEKVRSGPAGADEATKADYEWIMLEMYDQAVRNRSGGAMAEYLLKDKIVNEPFVAGRIGREFFNIRKDVGSAPGGRGSRSGPASTGKGRIKGLLSLDALRHKLVAALLGDEMNCLELGKFRCSGEVHQWMYDAHSLGCLMGKCGFEGIGRKTAFESGIEDWHLYGLDAESGIIHKPDSLFMEATRPAR